MNTVYSFKFEFKTFLTLFFCIFLIIFVFTPFMKKTFAVILLRCLSKTARKLTVTDSNLVISVTHFIFPH